MDCFSSNFSLLYCYIVGLIWKVKVQKTRNSNKINFIFSKKKKKKKKGVIHTKKEKKESEVA